MYLCSHLEEAEDIPPRSSGCEECLALGTSWVHLRTCLTCGHVGCCDNSVGRHATRHFQETQHPVMRSFEPDEDWGYCYVDHMFLDSIPARPREAAPVHYEAP